MVRKNIFELLEAKYEIKDEMNKIYNFFIKKFIRYQDESGYNFYSPESFFEEYILKTWKQRYSCIDICEIYQKLNLPTFFNDQTAVEDVINALEFYCNVIYLISTKFDLNNGLFEISDDMRILNENIQILLDQMHYQKKVFENEEKLILIPKNPAATSVAEISDEETAMDILMYNHHTLKGNLEAKRELLNSIARTYEPLLKSPIEGYKDFYEKTNQLLNNLHIRHNNFEEENNKNLVIDIDDKTLEHWYDELYQLLLFCVLIDDNLKRKKEAGEFLKQLKQGA